MRRYCSLISLKDAVSGSSRVVYRLVVPSLKVNLTLLVEMERSSFDLSSIIIY